MWEQRIPDIQAQAGLSHGLLGTTLLAGPVGNLLATRLTKRLTYRLAASAHSGRSKEENLADVSLFRMIAYTVGPVLIGWCAGFTSLPTALWLVVAMHGIVVWLGFRYYSAAAVR